FLIRLVDEVIIMKEEQNGTPKNKWSRLFRKKWFFPAVYLVVATLLLVGVVWYQNLDHQMPDMADDHDELTDTYTPNPFDEEPNLLLIRMKSSKCLSKIRSKQKS